MWPNVDLHSIKIMVIMTGPFIAGTVWAVVNAAQKEFETTGQKALWITVAGIPFVGFIFYFLLGARKGRTPRESTAGQ